MIAYGREDLLSQQLCVKYLETKWNSYGMYFHIANMSFYLLFLSLITANALKVIDVTHAANLSHHDVTVQTLINSNFASISQTKIVSAISSAIIVFVVLNIIKEFYQIYHQRLRYFTEFINIFEWTLYIASGVMSCSVVFGLNIHSSYLYICTAVSVFIAWFNLLFYLQRFNRGGIYVVMFLEILSTLIKVIFVFSVLIIAFGLSFYILFAKFNVCFLRFYFENFPGNLIYFCFDFDLTVSFSERLLSSNFINDSREHNDARRNRFRGNIFATNSDL